jgi:hypothetical protein
MPRKNNKSEFKLPRYLRLEKGSMWFDDQGEDSSNVRLYAFNKVLIGRETKLKTTIDDNGKEKKIAVVSDIPQDEYKNSNIVDYGKNDADLPWYVDTSKIPSEKLSRILLAYKFGILVEADPKNPPKPTKQEIDGSDFGFRKNGDRIFVGKNKEMYTKLQNYPFDELRKFVNNAPYTLSAKMNLMDLFDYERKGHNPLNRPRQEVLDLIRTKLNQYGNGISPLRVNEEDK